MRVKLITLMAGPKGLFQPGTEIEVGTEHGNQLVSGGFASEVKAVPSAPPAPIAGDETDAPDDSGDPAPPEPKRKKK